MKKVTIRILANAAYFYTDCLEIYSLASRLNDCYIDRGLYFSIDSRETGEDNNLSQCDLILQLLSTDEELTPYYISAAEQNHYSDKPTQLTWLKVGTQGQDTAAIRDRLELETGQHCSVYNHIDTLKLGLLMQLNNLGLDGVSIRLDSGMAWQGGVALLSLDKVESVSGYEELQRLKARFAQLEDHYYAAKAAHAENPADETAYQLYYKAAQERNTALREIREIETRLYHLMAVMNESTGQGELSRRQIEAYRMVERGLLSEAQEILDIRSIAEDYRHSQEMRDHDDQQAQIRVNEYLQLNDLYLTLRNWDGAETCLREAAKIEEKHDLPKKALYALVLFLLSQYRHNEGLEAALKLRWYHQKPEDATSLEERMHLLHTLGLLYQQTQRLDEAEKVLQSAITYLSDTKNDPPAQKFLANMYNALGYMLLFANRYNEAEVNLQAAYDIRSTLAEAQPDVYMEYIAQSQLNLGIVCLRTKRLSEAEALLISSMERHNQLFKENPKRFGLQFAYTYTNLGNIYWVKRDLTQAEKMHRAAFEVRQKLAEENPEAFEYYLAWSYISLGFIYRDLHRMVEAETMDKGAITLLKRLVARKPEANEAALASVYVNIGDLYTDLRRFAEAEEALNLALEIRRRLKERSPNAFDSDLAEVLNSLGRYYLETGRWDEAETALREAVHFYGKVAYEELDYQITYTMDLYYNIARLYCEIGRLDEAAIACQDAVAVYRKHSVDMPYCVMMTAKTEQLAERVAKMNVPINQALQDLTSKERDIALLLTEGLNGKEIARRLQLSSVEYSAQLNSLRAKVSVGTESDPVLVSVSQEFGLTKRETEMLRFLAKNLGYDAIATELFISGETVRSHVRNLLRKLGIGRRQYLAAWLQERTKPATRV